MAMTAETKARRAEDRQYQKRMNSLKPIAHQMEVLENCSTPNLSTVSVSIDGVAIKGIVRDINVVLEKLGYRPVRITSNMLNPNSPYFAIDINTPSYCDPGCESYHSM